MHFTSISSMRWPPAIFAGVKKLIAGIHITQIQTGHTMDGKVFHTTATIGKGDRQPHHVPFNPLRTALFARRNGIRLAGNVRTPDSRGKWEGVFCFGENYPLPT